MAIKSVGGGYVIRDRHERPDGTQSFLARTEGKIGEFFWVSRIVRAYKFSTAREAAKVAERFPTAIVEQIGVRK